MFREGNCRQSYAILNPLSTFRSGCSKNLPKNFIEFSVLSIVMSELDQEGCLSKQRYQVSLSIEYKRLYDEAKEQAKNATWMVYAGRGHEFPLLVEHTANVNLIEASAADIGTLVSYFAYREKSIDEILGNISWIRKIPQKA